MVVHDIVQGYVRIEIDSKIIGPPPSLQIQVCAWHNYYDKISHLAFNINAKVWKISIGFTNATIVLKPSSEQQWLTLLIPLSSDSIRLVEEERSRVGEDIEVIIETTCYYLGLPTSPSLYPPAISGPHNYSDKFKVSFTEWKNALGLKDFEPLLVSRDSIRKLDELRQKWGFFTHEDVIERFIELYEGIKIERPYVLLFTEPEIKTIKSKLSSLIESDIWSEVYAVSLYLDHTGAEYLAKLKKRGTQVKLLTRKPDKKEHKDAIEFLRKNNVEVKFNDMAHARFIVFDEIAAIVMTADLDANGLDNQRQIGFYITDRATVKACKTFFNRLWEEAEF
jgi:hypothetical protein